MLFRSSINVPAERREKEGAHRERDAESETKRGTRREKEKETEGDF